MFDIGWSEMAVVALLALLVIGPKDLPRVMRTASHWVRKARALGREFQSGVDEMIREADLDDAKNAIESTRNLDIDKVVQDTLDPTGSVEKEVERLEAEARAEVNDADAEDDGEDAEAPAGATIVKHPVQIAPPHSLTPPPSEEEAAPPPDDGTSKKRA